MIDKKESIYLAGHNGMVGSAILRALRANGFDNLLLADKTQLNLLNQQKVRDFFDRTRPDYVFLAAARVGGIRANIERPAEFMFENLTIQNNVIHSAFEFQVRKLIFVGSSCIYPRECDQPMKEEYLLTGPLEPTNEGYALAKIAGLKLLEYYHRQYGFKSVSLMPCNLYGTNDSFDPSHSHVLSALVKKFVDAADYGDQEVSVWGTGSARREFMHVDDAASAILFLFENHDSPNHINVGWGEDISIAELVALIREISAFKGKIIWDPAKPDGMPRKCLDVTKMRSLGFLPRITLKDGIERTIREYRTLKERVKK